MGRSRFLSAWRLLVTDAQAEVSSGPIGLLILRVGVFELFSYTADLAKLALVVNGGQRLAAPGCELACGECSRLATAAWARRFRETVLILAPALKP